MSPISLTAMEIETAGSYEEKAAGTAGVQWLLQPRGIRKGGRTHFRHTVQDGVGLASYADLLGQEAALLHQLFPAGTPARFWGATPAASAGNTKGKALRNCRVGDEVLFYNQRRFIARATITAKFRNARLAAALWGVDEEKGTTWEHMIALGDVVEFDIDARPVLAAVGIRDSLRSLTLVSAGERRSFLSAHPGPWPPRAAAPTPAQLPAVGVPAPRAPRPAAPALEEQTLLHAFGTLRTHIGAEGPSLHKPLALLWSIGRVAAGEERLAPWTVFEREVGALLEEFGGGAQKTPHYPFTRLRGSGIWEVQGVPADLTDPGPTALRAAGAKAGFADDAARLLRRARTRAKAVRLLRTRYLTDVNQPLVLDRVGLAGYLTASGEAEDVVAERSTEVSGPTGPVKRGPARGTRPERNPANISQVKGWYDDVCQVCATPLEVLAGRYSEAAHIQGIGTPHDGPDRTSNMLCLCPNHHKQFDRLGIYIDAQWDVRRTADDGLVSALHLHPQHEIESERVEYHRLLCGKSD